MDLLPNNNKWPADKVDTLYTLFQMKANIDKAIATLIKLVREDKTRGSAEMVVEATEKSISTLIKMINDTKQATVLDRLGSDGIDVRPLKHIAMYATEKGRESATSLFTVLISQASDAYSQLFGWQGTEFDRKSQAVRAYRLIKTAHHLQERMFENELLNRSKVKEERQRLVQEVLLRNNFPLAVIICVIDPYDDGTFDLSATVMELQKEGEYAIMVAERRGKWDKVETVTLRST